MNPIEKLQTILKEMDDNKNLYVANAQKDFTRNRKVTFYDMMWFLLFIGASSMAAILKSRSKIKVSAFEQLFHKFNKTLEYPKKYKGYRILAIDGSDFSSLYSADNEYATISNQYQNAKFSRLVGKNFGDNGQRLRRTESFRALQSN